MPKNSDDPIPAIIPEDVDPAIIITDPHVVADIEATGLKLERFESTDQEKLMLWLIDKSRDLERRTVDAEFAIDMGSDLNLNNRSLGRDLAKLATKGQARLIATRDNSKVVVQMVFTPAQIETARAGKNASVEYWRNRTQH